MRLKQKPKSNNKNISEKQSSRIKSSSIDNIKSSSKSKNIYLNKILQKNLGKGKITLEKTSLKDNISNFHSSIQNILSNEERRKKAINYVINLRNKQGTQPEKFSNTNYERFYNPILRKTYEILDDSNNYNYRSSQKEKSISIKSNINNNNSNFIKVNKINNSKYNNDEIRYLGDANIYKKNNEPKTQKQNINYNIMKNMYNTNDNNKKIHSIKTYKPNYNLSDNKYPKKNYVNFYEDNFDDDFIINDSENNQNYFNSNSDIPSDYINDFYKSPKINNQYENNEGYYEEFKYNNNNIGKTPNYAKQNNYMFKNMPKSRTNINFSSGQKLNNNKQTYTRVNFPSERKDKSIKTIKQFDNLKIEKNKIILKIINAPKNKNETKKLFKNIVSISINKFNIKGKPNKKINGSNLDTINKDIEILKNKNKENENIIKNQKKEIETKSKEIIKLRNNINLHNNETKKMIDLQKNYENIVKINNKMKEEKKNYIKEINKLKENLNKINEEEKVEQKLKEAFNKLKDDYDNVDEQYNELKEKINLVIEENQKIKEENKKLNNEINIVKQNKEGDKDKNTEELDVLKKQINEMNKNMNELNEKNKKINDELNNKNIENKNLININNKYQIELNKLKTDSEKNLKEKEENNKLNNEIKTLKENLNNTITERDNYKERNELNKTQIDKLNNELTKLKEEINKLNEESEKLKEEKNKKELNQIDKNEFDKLNEEFININKEKEKYKIDIENIRKEKELELNKNNQLQEDNKSLNEQIKKLISENEKEKIENNNIQNKYNQLIEEINKLKEENDKLRIENLNQKEKKEKESQKEGEQIILENAQDNSNIENKAEEITFPEPIIIKNREKRAPSKFKKDRNNIIPQPKTEENQKEEKKSDFQQKLDMFNKKEEKKEEEKKPIEKENITKKEVKFENEEKNKKKEEKMSRALQRLKKGREKKAEKENNENNNNFNDIKFKSARIKNMAELLESHMHKQDNKDEENKDIGKNIEEDPFENMTKLLQNRDSKILKKKKMTKKNFEE